MSTATLTSLLDYLTGTLSPNNMRWIGEHLIEYARKEQIRIQPKTLEEMKAQLLQAKQDFDAGLGVPDEEAWDELEKMECEDQGALELAEAI